MISRIASRYLSWLLAVALLYGVGRAVSWPDAWAALRLLDGPALLLLIAVNGLVLLALNGRWWLILRGQGYPISLLTLTGYRLAAFGLSYITPGPHFGGEPLQVLLVERRHHVPRTIALAAVTLDKTLELLVNFSFLLAGVTLVLEQGVWGQAIGGEAAVLVLGLLSIPLLFLLAIWRGRRPLTRMLAPALGWSWLRRHSDWYHAYQTAVAAVADGEAQATHFCRHAPRALVAAFAASLLGWLLLIAEYGLLLSFLGVELTAVQLITALTAMRVAYLLPLPGGLGAMEASQMLALNALGLNGAVGVSASLLIRLRDVLLASLGLWWGQRQLRRKCSQRCAHSRL